MRIFLCRSCQVVICSSVLWELSQSFLKSPRLPISSSVFVSSHLYKQKCHVSTSFISYHHSFTIDYMYVGFLCLGCLLFVSFVLLGVFCLYLWVFFMFLFILLLLFWSGCFVFKGGGDRILNRNASYVSKLVQKDSMFRLILIKFVVSVVEYIINWKFQYDHYHFIKLSNPLPP